MGKFKVQPRISSYLNPKPETLPTWPENIGVVASAMAMGVTRSSLEVNGVKYLDNGDEIDSYPQQ